MAVRVLGPLEVSRDGHAVIVSGVRRRALLVRLVISANEVIPAGRLIEDLWEGAPPSGAASTLQSHVSALRSLIGSDRIRFVDGGYVLTLEASECDIHSISEVAEARRAELAGDLELAADLLERWLNRWRGDALADVVGASWALGEGTRLDELRVGALEQWLGVRLGLGDHATVVADAERAVNEFPLREGFWSALMLAQYRSGRQSDALRTFRRLCSMLGDELGIEPSAELCRLEQAMLLQSPDLDWRPIADVARAGGKQVLPSGTVTFLFAKIEGWTPLVEQLGDEALSPLLQEYRDIVRRAIAAHHGVEVSSDDAGFFVVFTDTGEALAAATEVQAALGSKVEAKDTKFRVGIGLHTGVGRCLGDTYAGLAVQQASLVCQAANGGQIVATHATRAAAGALHDGMSWRPLGQHHLHGLSMPVELHQLCDPALEEVVAPLRTDGAFTHHLPVQVSSFLGRVEELSLGAKLLAANRLVSVVGPGGAGKTRVAYRLAETQLTHFRDGVWVAELAPEADPERIPALVLTGLGLRDEPGRDALETIVSHLRDRQALVVLDNCEHMVQEAASFAAALLQACGKVRVLVTSREPLRIAGEAVWPLGALDLPEPGTGDLGAIAGVDAVALFCERAAAADVRFALDFDNVAAVTTICRRVEGMPLAIELAAARVRTLPLSQIAERLENSLDLLSKRGRQGTDRHGSLRAALAWSHDLLAPSEQTLFRRLAVFAGGFTLAAAEDVGAGVGLDATEVLDALDGLVDKSLVSLTIDQAGQGRYWLLETVRAYARELLDAAGELATQSDRHAQFYTGLAHGSNTEAGITTYDRLEEDHSNLLAALQYFADGEQADEHGRLVLDLATFWDLRGYWRLGERELRRYLARKDPSEAPPACFRLLATLTARTGDYDEARAFYQEGLSAAQRIGDQREEVACLAGLGRVAWYVADYVESGTWYDAAVAMARKLGLRLSEGKWLGNRAMVHRGVAEFAEAKVKYEQALELVREVGDRRAEGAFRGSLGLLASDTGDLQEALASYREALAIFREVGDRLYESGFLGNIGLVSLQLGDYEESRMRFEEALAITRELGDKQSEGCWIGNLGEVAHYLGDDAQAQRRLGEALAIARQVGDRRSQRDWLVALGGIERGRGHHVESTAHYREALAIARVIGRPDDALLGACAELLVALQRHEEAAELLGATDEVAHRTKRYRTVFEQSRDQTSLAACRASLSEKVFELAYDRGCVADWEFASARAEELLGRV